MFCNHGLQNDVYFLLESSMSSLEREWMAIVCWESARFKGPDDFNGCGYFHIRLLLIALRHICRWNEEDLGSEFV